MIGGTDIRIPTRAGASALELCVRAIMQFWPNAVFEDGRSGKRFEQIDALPIGLLVEVFVYRDAAIARKWELEGAVPELEDTMVHLLGGSGEITVVVDRPDQSPMDRVLAALRSGLSADIFSITVDIAREAA